MNILNKQIDSIYDRQKNLYSKYPHYSQQNAESKKVCEQEKITATSGKDVLGITKGDKENSYIVHFSDSAMVSRAVARGYITVNGADLELTEQFLQMGIDELSVSPGRILPIRKIVRESECGCE